MKTARLAWRQKSQSKALSANIFVRYGWLLFSFVLLLTTLTNAQLYTGSIAGTVTDPSGSGDSCCPGDCDRPGQGLLLYRCGGLLWMISAPADSSGQEAKT